MTSTVVKRDVIYGPLPCKTRFRYGRKWSKFRATNALTKIGDIWRVKCATKAAKEKSGGSIALRLTPPEPPGDSDAAGKAIARSLHIHLGLGDADVVEVTELAVRRRLSCCLPAAQQILATMWKRLRYNFEKQWLREEYGVCRSCQARVSY